MKQVLLTTLALIVLSTIPACRTHHSKAAPPPQPLPGWVSQPKMNDSVNLYFIGASDGQASMQAARLAAIEDAQKQLSQLIARESGLGPEALDFNGQLPLPPVQPVPGCFHYQLVGGTYSGWIQVSFPIREKRDVVEKLRAQ